MPEIDKNGVVGKTGNDQLNAEVGLSDSNAFVRLPMPDGMTRPETSPMQFGDDWPGMFIRGDDAAWMAHSMLIAAQSLGDSADDQINAKYLKLYAERLRACRAT